MQSSGQFDFTVKTIFHGPDFHVKDYKSAQLIKPELLLKTDQCRDRGYEFPLLDA